MTYSRSSHDSRVHSRCDAVAAKEHQELCNGYRHRPAGSSDGWLIIPVYVCVVVWRCKVCTSASAQKNVAWSPLRNSILPLLLLHQPGVGCFGRIMRDKILPAPLKIVDRS
jgi:hypothetical protein